MAIRLRDRKQVLFILSQNHSLAYSCRVVGIFRDVECLPRCHIEWRNFLVFALAIIVWQSCCPAQAGEFEIRLASKEKADGYQSLPLADGVAPVFVDSAICLYRNHVRARVTVVIVFMVLSIFIGVLSEQVLKKIHKHGGPAIPYTAFILIVGLLTRIAAEAPGTYKHFACSFQVWETMDGHLLLYAFIPPLVFGDAMNLDFNVLKNCVSQCATLAFPGVAIGAALFAIVVQYVIPSTGHWTWDLSMAFGAVMSATDPIAVVALLKQLGAPDSLTMIIGGESLLNDGTAVVAFLVMQSVAGGCDTTAGKVIISLIKLAGGGVLWGGGTVIYME